MRGNRVIFRILIAAALASLPCMNVFAQARRDGAAAAPPPVVSQNVTVARGGSVAIPLAIHGTRAERLEFIIRTPPSHGKLSAPRSTGMNGAVVTYTPSARSRAAEDRFTFAVQGREGVSAPGLVTIRFTDAAASPAMGGTTGIPPKLKTPVELEFPPVFPGQRSTVEMEVVNEGGGFAEGEVKVPEPWMVEGINFFRLAANERASIRISFVGDAAGTATGEARISGATPRVVSLRAVVEEQFSVAPPQVRLAAQAGSQTRSGEIQITNRAPDDALVKVEAGGRLLADGSVKIPGRGTATVRVFADAADAGAFDEKVRLSSGKWSATVAVRAVAVGAILKFAKDAVHIRGVAGGISAAGSATLENSGGEAATVRLDIDPPFEIESRVVTVPGRGTIDIPIRAPGAGPGSHRGRMRVAGEGQTASVELIAELAARDAPVPRGELAKMTVPDAPASGTPAVVPVAKTERPPVDSALIPMTLQDIPNTLGRFGRATGPDSAVIEWPAELTQDGVVRFEERILSLGEDDQLKIDWRPLPHARLEKVDAKVIAEFRGLAPATLYTVRVMAGNGADAGVAFTSDFQTPREEPMFDIGWRVPSLLAALAVLAYLVRKRRKA